jgi:hypothetical protein
LPGFVVRMLLARLDVGRQGHDTRGMATKSSIPPGALAFSREVYASTLDWYKVADSKGQLLLALNGVYITVLSSVTIASSQNMVKLRTSLPPVTWFLLVGAAVATAVSILMAIAGLYSRLSNTRLDESIKERDPRGGNRYRPAALYWFGTIARVADVDPSTGLRMLRSADEAFELSAVTEDLFQLASKVLAKHRYVNKGWVAAGASLLFLLAAAASTVIAT